MDPPTREPRNHTRQHTRVQSSQGSVKPAGSPPRSTLAPAVMITTKPRQQSTTSIPPQDEEAIHGIVGQIAATQTTVVTTTTTTTTKLPPLLLNPPKHLNDMDPKQYPLAASPTPSAVRRLSFKVEGRKTTFEEMDDTLDALGKHSQEGASTTHNDNEESALLPPPALLARQPEMSVSRLPASGMVRTPKEVGRSKTPASPVSISEAATRASHQGSRKTITSAVKRSLRPVKDASISRLRTIQTSTPITPHVGSNELYRDRQSPIPLTSEEQEQDSQSKLSTTTSSPVGVSGAEEEDDECQILSPSSEAAQRFSSRDEAVTTPIPASVANVDIRPPTESVITPNDDEDLDSGGPNLDYSTRRRRLRPNMLDTTAAQDASLPSPSLSPITAAASQQSRRSYFEQPDHIRAGRSLGQASHDMSLPQQSHLTPEGSREVSFIKPMVHQNEQAESGPSNTSLLQIPAIIDTFEAMPEEMKSYIMYQMLRRCSRPVLHFVADVVNPALKCDFLRQLPVELCLNVIGNLDVKSLCSAAQVSKRWRQLVDSSEKVWKRLFDQDGYELEAGELPRAIREGWGWQNVSRLDDSERDLSSLGLAISDADLSVHDTDGAFASANPRNAVSLQSKRLKRKAKPSAKWTGRKQRKRSHPQTNQMDLDDETIMDMTAAEGPYAAATAAAGAVPYPGIGLSSLKNLHLFKSIYLRHHIVRDSWMKDEVTPRHIAFRAHEGHVVTCLQFDSEKILTGSDDSKINVYDTQTGALRAILSGHEGGVWALQYHGNVLVSGSTDRSVRVWDIERGVCTQTFQGHTSTVRCLQILMPTRVGTTTDGRPIMMPKQPLIITGSRDSNLRVWLLPKPGDAPFHQAGPAPDESTDCPYFVRALTGHGHSVRAIAAHADTLVSGSYDTTVRVWKISTGETLHRLQGHTQKVYSVVLDSKRNRCISGSMDNAVKVWSLDTGAVLFTLEGHSSLVGLLDLQQDRLVSAAADSTLRIWNPENAQCKATLRAHTGAITCFQHDGQKVISGSDRTLKMWDVATGAFVKDLLTDLSGVWQVKFNERRCVAAVQRNNLTYIEVLDFGALRDGVIDNKRGRRIVVNTEGRETADDSEVVGGVSVHDLEE